MSLTASPTLLSSLPADGSSIGNSADLYLYFSEAVKPGSGTIRLYKADGTLVESFDVDTGQGSSNGNVSFNFGEGYRDISAVLKPGSKQLRVISEGFDGGVDQTFDLATGNKPAGGLASFGRGTVKINPGANLEPGASYYLQIDGGAVLDYSNQPYAGISNNTTLNFTTTDAGPRLDSSYPSDQSVFNTAADLSFYFTETVVPGPNTSTSNFSLYKADGTLVESFNTATGAGTASGTVQIIGSKVNLDPGADLVDGAEYYIQIGNTAVKDNQGQYFAGINNKTTLNFSATDFVPTLNFSDPQDGGSFNYTNDIRFYFSEPVQAGSGYVELRRSGDTSVVEKFNIATGAGDASGSLVFNGSVVTINPGANLVPGTGYYLLVSGSGFKDSTNQLYAGISSATALNFTAIDAPPALLGSSPADGGSAEKGNNLNLFFSETIDAGTGTVRLYRSDNTLVESFDVSTGQGSAGGALDGSGSTLFINPGTDLVPGTGYYLLMDSGAITDTTGNVFGGISSPTTLNFTAVDNAPTLAYHTASGTGKADKDSDFFLGFSEAVQAGSGLVRLYKADNTLVETFNPAAQTGDKGGNAVVAGSTLRIDPAQPLVAGSSYYIKVDGTALKDGSGKFFAGIADSTTVSFGAIDGPPGLDFYSWNSNKLDTNVTLTFTENVVGDSGTITLHRASDDSLIETFTIGAGGDKGGTLSFSGTAVTLNPGSNLGNNQNYYLKIGNTAIEDDNGQHFTQSFDIRFGISDPAPTLYSSSPPDGGTLSHISDIFLNFSENIVPGNGVFELYKADNTLVQSFDVSAAGPNEAIEFLNSTVVLRPTADLAVGSGYYLKVAGTAVKDTVGQYFAGISDTATLNFTAFDGAPTLVFSTPLDNGTLEPGNDLFLNFSETVQGGTGNVSLYKSDNTLVESFAAATGVGSKGGSLANLGSTIRIDPIADLLAGASYYLKIDSTAFKDSANNPYAGINDATTLNFTVADGAPSLLTQYSAPQDNASWDKDSPLRLEFSEDILAGAGAVRLYKDGTTPTLVETFTLSTKQGDAGGDASIFERHLTIRPGSPLVPGSGYHLQIDGNAIKDSSGNFFTGISEPTTYNFSAIDGPPALDYGHYDLKIDTNLNLVFTESIFPGSTGAVYLYKQSDGSLIETFPITALGSGTQDSLSISGDTLRINPAADLENNQTYTIKIDSTVLKDSLDQYYPGLAGFNFPIQDEAPTLSSTSPADGGSASVSGNIILNFSETVFAGSGLFRLFKSNGDLVESFDVVTKAGSAGGSLTLSGSKVELNPQADLLPGTGYYVKVDATAIEDYAGQNFAGIADSSTFNFSVGVTPLLLTGSNPADNGSVDLGADLFLNFSEAIFAGSGTVRLYKNGSQTPVETFNVANASAYGPIEFDGNTLILRPAADLMENSSYWLEIDSTAIKNSANTNFAGISGDSTLNFTATDGPPVLVSSYPVDGGEHELDNDLNLYFSEPIQLGNNSEVARLYRVGETEAVVEFSTGGENVNVSQNHVTLHLYQDLVAGAEYYLHIGADAFKDSKGQFFAGIADSTTLNFTAVDDPPTLIWSTADEGFVDYADPSFTLVFSETVIAGPGAITLYDADDNVVPNPVVSFYDNVVLIEPATALTQGGSYYIKIDPDAIKDDDSSVDFFAGISDTTSLAFTAEDPPPVLTYSWPEDDYQEYEYLGDPFYLYFSEAIQQGEGSATLYKAGGIAVESFDFVNGGSAGGSLWIGEGSALIIEPGAPLEDGQEYYLLVAAGLVVDNSEQPFAGISSPSTLNFTAFNPPPELYYSDPADDGFLDPGAPISLYFWEDIYPGSSDPFTGYIELYDSSDVLVERYDVSNGTGSAEGTITFEYYYVDIQPGPLLTQGAGYYLLVSDTAIVDMYDKPFAGISDKNVLNFTVDDWAPTLVGTNIVGEELETGANLILTFSEPVTASPGTLITLFRSEIEAPVPVASFSYTEGVWTGTNGTLALADNILTIDPDALLPNGDYYLQIVEGNLLDLTANQFIGLTGVSDLVFNVNIVA